MAAVTSLCATAALAPAASAALPDLVQQAPTGITMGYYDDHSIGGDNHMGWGFSGSDPEPLAISFQANLRNAGAGPLQLCAGPSSDGNWRVARQTEPSRLGDCSGPQVNTQNLYFRYAIANHSDQVPSTFNRWHVMDLQRFALVPVNPAGDLDRNRRTIWDNQWGTCLQLDGDMACERNAGAASLNAGISAGTTKITQEGAPDQARIAFFGLETVPSGRYQVVAMANPYGVFREAGNGTGSVACRTVQLTTDPNAGSFAVAEIAQLPATCWVPTTMQSRAFVPGGTDPFQGARADDACGLTPTGHCWTTIPEFDDPVNDPLSPHPIAHTNVDNGRATTATSAVAIAQGGTINVTPPAGGGGGTTPPPVVVPNPNRPSTTPPAVTPKGPKAIPPMTTAKGRSHARTALRRTFGTLPSSATVRCILTGGSTAECDVTWRRRGGVRYRGKVQVWFSSDVQQVRWNYGMSVKRTKPGSRARTTTRRNIVGGSIAS